MDAGPGISDLDEAQQQLVTSYKNNGNIAFKDGQLVAAILWYFKKTISRDILLHP